MITIDRLDPQDAEVLALLNARDAEFDEEGSGGAQPPLSPAEADAFLRHPSVHVWIARDGAAVVGFLLAHELPMRRHPARELLLYEIGVHRDARRRGVGRQLIAAMRAWMQSQAMSTVWVLAGHAGAERFYEACGFHRGDGFVGYFEMKIDEP